MYAYYDSMTTPHLGIFTQPSGCNSLIFKILEAFYLWTEKGLVPSTRAPLPHPQNPRRQE